ncbi:MAG: hypothetical protein F6J86_03220 [Symploca sp. SIO1B1]|nr:hypothetical protein [Symploca sp. SIO2D2]NER19233.1 hypothetical protein [Symploca sp. SIO1C2]NER92860.1 hypothetical protein [Symploca sp. SIO1B1]
MATAQKENTLILRMGKFKKDDIDDLRYGEGRIFKKIEYVLEQLQESGQLSENYQPIIVVTKKKKEKDW